MQKGITYTIDNNKIKYIAVLDNTRFGVIFESQYDLNSTTGLLLQHLEFINKHSWNTKQQQEWEYISQQFKKDIMYKLMAYL